MEYDEKFKSSFTESAHIMLREKYHRNPDRIIALSSEVFDKRHERGETFKIKKGTTKFIEKTCEEAQEFALRMKSFPFSPERPDRISSCLYYSEFYLCLLREFESMITKIWAANRCRFRILELDEYDYKTQSYRWGISKEFPCLYILKREECDPGFLEYKYYAMGDFAKHEEKLVMDPFAYAKDWILEDVSSEYLARINGEAFHASYSLLRAYEEYWDRKTGSRVDDLNIWKLEDKCRAAYSYYAWVGSIHYNIYH
jgi:hypothetical protein